MAEIVFSIWRFRNLNPHPMELEHQRPTNPIEDTEPSSCRLIHRTKIDVLDSPRAGDVSTYAVHMIRSFALVQRTAQNGKKNPVRPRNTVRPISRQPSQLGTEPWYRRDREMKMNTFRVLDDA